MPPLTRSRRSRIDRRPHDHHARHNDNFCPNDHYSPAPTTTVPAPTTTVPAPTTTVPAPTTTVPAPTTTVHRPARTTPPRAWAVEATTSTSRPAPTTTRPAPTTTARPRSPPPGRRPPLRRRRGLPRPPRRSPADHDHHSRPPTSLPPLSRQVNIGPDIPPAPSTTQKSRSKVTTT